MQEVYCLKIRLYPDRAQERALEATLETCRLSTRSTSTTKEIGGYPGLESGPGYVARMNNIWGWLVTGNIAPVWIGEMGSSMATAPSEA